MIKESSSFRDPSGYIFRVNNQIYRAINHSYSEDYQFLSSSGLLDKLFQDRLLVKHEEILLPEADGQGVFAIIKPETIPVITYPYEWGFSQLKEAALLTLKVLTQALEHDMILKDASAFNVQFRGYKPVFIDTLSFQRYQVGQPWLGYKQFCEHFLAPLCLTAYMGIEMQKLTRLSVDGISLEMTSKLLPLKTWFSTVPLFHIHLHAKSNKFYSVDGKSDKKRARVSKRDLLAMIDHLHNFISSLKLNKAYKTQWQDYDLQTHYTNDGRGNKAKIIGKFVNQINARVIWDMGANDGFFSRAIADPERLILSMDLDPLALEKNFLQNQSQQKENIYSLVYDVANPSPDWGWANKERSKLTDRSTPDAIMALAVIHHLVISNNVPFVEVANYFAQVSKWLIIEFVPREDEKINSLPATAGKENYSRIGFEKGFSDYFEIVDEQVIKDSKRSILLMKRKL